MTPTEFCQVVENRLGWSPCMKAAKTERYKPMAKKVTEKVATDPALYTWDNLMLAVQLLANEHKARNPLGVFAHVERAVAMAKEPERDVELDIRAAIRVEQHRGDPDGWVTRFSRASGGYRRLALDEWRATQ